MILSSGCPMSTTGENMMCPTMRPLAQRVDEIRLRGCFERFHVDGANCRAIGLRLSADHHKRVGLLRHTAQVSTGAKLTPAT